MRHFTRAVLVLAAAVAAVATTGAATAGASERAPGIPITFQKHLVDPENVVFQGSTGGAVSGTLESRLVPGTLTIDGDLWTFEFDWVITADVPAKSCVMHAAGTMIGTNAGSPVVMDGVVTSGWHAGAALHMQGTLVDPSTFTIAGTLTIQPGSSAS
jgi:hypothetical protein